MEQKPNLFVIGSAKCGTTTVARVLGEHPDCCMSDPKEPHYFCEDDKMAKGWDWYRQCWQHYEGEPIIAEATADYTDFPQHPNCADRIAAFNSNAKIIYIVRHPMEKLVSMYRHFWAEDSFNARSGFEPFLRHMFQEHQLLDACKYQFQLERYQEKFPANQILVLFLENWKIDPSSQIRKLFAFVGLRADSVESLAQLRENSASSHRVEKQWFTRLRRNSMTRLVGRSLVPSKIRYAIGKTVGSTPSTSLPLSLSASLTTDIVHAVKPDADQFFNQFREDAPQWNWINPPWKVV